MSETNFELYKNERFKFGSREKEEAEFRDHARRVRAAQETLLSRHSTHTPRRVFHTKSHGCLKGKLQLLSNRPEITRHGLFAGNGRENYNVLVRFSNGVGIEQRDIIPDVRGLAIKIFGVTDSSIPPEKQRPQTVDCLMFNSPTPFGNDQEEFVQFMEASVKPGLLHHNLAEFLFEHQATAQRLFKATGRIVHSLAAEQYWSGHGYLLGPNQAMKFNLRPSEDVAVDTTEMDSLQSRLVSASGFRRWLEMFEETAKTTIAGNYLSADLSRRIRRQPIKFDFRVQLEKDSVHTPLEEGLVEWTEEVSPSIQVAELVLDRQDRFVDCEDLAFTPGHYIAAHRPLGNIGRGRIFTYLASQLGRGAQAVEPDEKALFS